MVTLCCKEPIEINKRQQCIEWIGNDENNTCFIIRLFMIIFTFAVLCYSFTTFVIPTMNNAYNHKKFCVQFHSLCLTHWVLFAETAYFIIILYLHGKCLYKPKLFDKVITCNEILFYTIKSLYCFGTVSCVILGHYVM